MKSHKFKISVITLAAITMLQPALAAETKADTVSPVENSMNKLLNFRDDTSLKEENKLLKELEIRKDVLNEVFTLSLEEVAKLTARIDVLPEFAENSREKALRDEFKLSLENYSTYYRDQSKKLADLTTIGEVKNLAQKIKDYRDEIYNPQIQQIVNFILLFYNENVLKIANARLDKISADIQKLEKLGYIKAGAFASEMKFAAQTLNDARAFFEEAKKAVFAPSQSEEETVIESGISAPMEDEKAQPPVEPNKLMENSLNKVKSAYDTFLKVGKGVRKILGM